MTNTVRSQPLAAGWPRSGGRSGRPGSENSPPGRGAGSLTPSSGSRSC